MMGLSDKIMRGVSKGIDAQLVFFRREMQKVVHDVKDVMIDLFEQRTGTLFERLEDRANERHAAVGRAHDARVALHDRTSSENVALLEKLMEVDAKLDAVLTHETRARNEQKVVRKQLRQPDRAPSTLTGLGGPKRKNDGGIPERVAAGEKVEAVDRDTQLGRDASAVAAVVVAPPVGILSASSVARIYDLDVTKVKKAMRGGMIANAMQLASRSGGWSAPADDVEAWVSMLPAK